MLYSTSSLLAGTLLPFLYPRIHIRSLRTLPRRLRAPKLAPSSCYAQLSTTATHPNISTPADSTHNKSDHESDSSVPSDQPSEELATDRLNPSPDDYYSQPFTDTATLILHAGAGGNGCVSFLRAKYISEGPPNGGDGGTGGSVYITASPSVSSLHSLTRVRIRRAGRGRNGTGLGGGRSGPDLLVEVPVGTVARELWRHDPVAAEERLLAREARLRSRGDAAAADAAAAWKRRRWVHFPGSAAARPTSGASAEAAAADYLRNLPAPRRHALAAAEPERPLHLDFSSPSARPRLLLAGGTGGLGNPHFATVVGAAAPRSGPPPSSAFNARRPKVATRGTPGAALALRLELRAFADCALVGAPNAGKSTLLRALTNSRARVGDWAFTTLSPNIGTVVLDDDTGRPRLQAWESPDDDDDHHHLAADAPRRRTALTVADVPGLVAGAHADRGLGHAFLRHAQRARCLALVLDLADPLHDPAATLRDLWREIAAYDALQRRGGGADAPGAAPSPGPTRTTPWSPARARAFLADADAAEAARDAPEPAVPAAAELDALAAGLDPLPTRPLCAKPWLVVANKADLPGAEARFAGLRAYVERATREGGGGEHPAGVVRGGEEGERFWWPREGGVRVVPVSARRGEGVGAVVEGIVSLL